jgi:hypothetical protein
MRPGFQRDPAVRQAAENFAQRFCTRTHPLFQLDLANFIQHAVPAVAIAQIQSNGQFLLRNIPDRLRRCGANLFHCRSPFYLYLCFEHVDNLGAYSIPSGDRPSHPSDLQHLSALWNWLIDSSGFKCLAPGGKGHCRAPQALKRPRMYPLTLPRSQNRVPAQAGFSVLWANIFTSAGSLRSRRER